MLKCDHDRQLALLSRHPSEKNNNNVSFIIIGILQLTQQSISTHLQPFRNALI